MHKKYAKNNIFYTLFTISQKTSQKQVLSPFRQRSCKTTGEPAFLTKNGEGDLVVMDITAYDQHEKQPELREKLIEIEELRRTTLQQN